MVNELTGTPSGGNLTWQSWEKDTLDNDWYRYKAPIYYIHNQAAESPHLNLDEGEQFGVT